MRKLTIEYIRNEFEKESAVLLSEVYVNSKVPLEYICPNGHYNTIIWNSWQRGARCSVCSGRETKDFNVVKKSFESENYVVLSKKYYNNKIPIEYICSNGHKHKIRWCNWRRGQRCPYCVNVAKLNINQVEKGFTDAGYELLSKNYENNHTKLSYICPSGHKGRITWLNWSNGARCWKCNHLDISLRQVGPKNHNWRGGISYEPYCEIWKDKEYKEDIKERDGHRCLNPYCDSKNPDDLVIHHIDYNKKNCGPENLITICRSCNNKANKDRQWHKAWYRAILKNRYGYRRI